MRMLDIRPSIVSSASSISLPSEAGNGSQTSDRSHTGPVRPLTPNDLSQVRDLYRGGSDGAVDDSAAFLKRIFFEPPWLDDSMPSLAYEDESGRIIACLGIMPRDMKFRGRAVRAAVGHHFIVDPSRKGARAGVELARRFLKGPQDLALAEGNAFSRRIWEYGSKGER